jgi:ABC-type transport system involved in cytochrome c biogenesis permease component
VNSNLIYLHLIVALLIVLLLLDFEWTSVNEAPVANIEGSSVISAAGLAGAAISLSYRRHGCDSAISD